jgi:hypothetical protein
MNSTAETPGKQKKMDILLNHFGNQSIIFGK